MARGGKREGSGRKPKADEIAMIDTMDSIAAPRDVWEKLYALVEIGDTQAIKTWLAYRFGQPKQTVDTNVTGDIVWNETKTYGPDRKADTST